MKKLNKALQYEQTRTVLAEDSDYHKGYIQALRDVKNNNLHYGTAVCQKIEDCGYTVREVANQLKVETPIIEKVCYDGILNRTLMARRIAKMLDVSVEEVIER